MIKFEEELQCPNCRINSLTNIGNWDDDILFKCMNCRGWFRESYITGKNKDALCMREVEIEDLK